MLPIVQQALLQPNLVKALTYIMIWENDRIMKLMTSEGIQDDEYETTFEFILKQFMDEWRKKVNGVCGMSDIMFRREEIIDEPIKLTLSFRNKFNDVSSISAYIEDFLRLEYHLRNILRS